MLIAAGSLKAPLRSKMALCQGEEMLLLCCSARHPCQSCSHLWHAKCSLPNDFPALKGCWGDRSGLLMLPHMDIEAVDRLQQLGIHTLPQLATKPEKDAAALLARVLGAGKAVSDVQQVGGLRFALPSLDQASASHCLRGQWLP